MINTADITNNGWVVIVYKLPSHPSRIRVHVWRKLKKYGALYYQQGVAMLPGSEHFTRLLQELKSEIDSYGGNAVLARLSFMDACDDKKATNHYNEGLTREYYDIRETGNKILNEIEISRKANLLNLAYLEEKLILIKRLKNAYETIKARDCFKVRLHERIEEHMDTLFQTIQRYYAEFK